MPHVQPHGPVTCRHCSAASWGHLSSPRGRHVSSTASKNFMHHCALSEQKFLNMDQCEQLHAFTSLSLELVTSGAREFMENTTKHVNFWGPCDSFLFAL